MSILAHGFWPVLMQDYGRWGIWIVGVGVAVESMGVLIAPGESLVIAAGALAASGTGPGLAAIIAAAAIGAITGDNIGFCLGRGLGHRLLVRHGPRIGLTEQRQRLGQTLFARYGGAVIFFGRFIAVLRAFVALLSGANGMAWSRFLLFNVLGGVAWSGLYATGGYVLGHEAARLEGPVGLAIGAVAVVVIIVAVIVLRRNEARLAALK
jgi:membrane protein DedA with SNARE-associated domain